MDKLEALIESIKSDDLVVRYKELETRVNSDEKLMSAYQKLLNLQKIMVQHEAKKSPRYLESKKDYEKQYEIVMNHCLMTEYLDVLELVNNDLQLVQEIIINELAVDFE